MIVPEVAQRPTKRFLTLGTCLYDELEKYNKQCTCQQREFTMVPNLHYFPVIIPFVTY